MYFLHYDVYYYKIRIWYVFGLSYYIIRLRFDMLSLYYTTWDDYGTHIFLYYYTYLIFDVSDWNFIMLKSDGRWNKKIKKYYNHKNNNLKKIIIK